MALSSDRVAWWCRDGGGAAAGRPDRVERALMEAADRRVLLLDHSEFAENGLHQLAALTAFDVVVVDSAIPGVLLTSLVAHGLTVHRAGVDQHPPSPSA
jgi:DeoR/GlpR family transcriptional regulator of sugar metabolism